MSCIVWWYHNYYCGQKSSFMPTRSLPSKRALPIAKRMPIVDSWGLSVDLLGLIFCFHSKKAAVRVDFSTKPHIMAIYYHESWPSHKGRRTHKTMKVHSPICKLDVIFGHLIEGLESLFGFLYLKIKKKKKRFVGRTKTNFFGIYFWNFKLN